MNYAFTLKLKAGSIHDFLVRNEGVAKYFLFDSDPNGRCHCFSVERFSGGSRQI